MRERATRDSTKDSEHARPSKDSMNTSGAQPAAAAPAAPQKTKPSPAAPRYPTGVIYAMVALALLIAALLLSLVLTSNSNGNEDEREEIRNWGRDGVEVDTTTPLEGPPPIKSQYATHPAVRAEQAGRLLCFTLEAYSARFLAPPSAAHKTHAPLFLCGTRVTDLRTTTNARVIEACQHGSPARSSSQAPINKSTHPHLRLVLTVEESAAHMRQRHNTAAQRIPLAQLNDDYCDCLDGSDEPLTSACSMSGPGMVLAGSRWRQYVVANQHVKLYHDTLGARTGGNPLYELGGIVLPVRCAADPSVLLAPSRVGDGIVDCCDGSDEGTPVGQQPPADRTQGDVSALPHDVQQQWQHRRESLERHLSTHAPTSYADKLHPYDDSARALLVSRGYTALFSCPAVQQQRLSTARALLKLVRRGHRTQKVRAAKGWSRLGQEMVHNSTVLKQRLYNMTASIEAGQQRVVQALRAARTNDLRVAGIDPAEVHAVDELIMQRDFLMQELQLTSIVTVQHVFGRQYEYYPLYDSALRISPEDVVYSAASDTPSVRAERQRRLVSVTAALKNRNTLRTRGFHVDNISVDWYGVMRARGLLAAQRYDKATEGEVVLRRLGALQPDEPYDPTAQRWADGDPFKLSPTLVLGHWQPYRTEQTAAALSLLDPAGDVDLPRRMFVRPHNALTRGGGRLAYASREPEPERTLRFNLDHKQDAERLRDTAAGRTPREEAVPLPYRENTPNLVATHVFAAGLRCALDTPSPGVEKRASEGEPEEPLSYGHVVYVCDTKDSVLQWGINGKCAHEVVVGTPSACASWVVKAAEEHLQQLTRSSS